jgi:L-2-hydroxyglutarate oxidase LhgO
MIQAKLVKESSILVPDAISVKTWNRKPPGIRAQLVHLPSGKLEQDFVVRGLENSTHVLNAVSPGWTSSLPFGRWVAAQVSKILS